MEKQKSGKNKNFTSTVQTSNSKETGQIINWNVQMHQREVGRIYLVGAGPGSPDLLTRAAIRAIESADLVLADRLVPAGVLALIPKHSELFIARKYAGKTERAQIELMELAIDALKRNQIVVRLKQGDPYIFGRGGEEMQVLKEAGYDPILVPGVTSALSAPLFCDIPTTHRGVSDQVLIITGTGRKGALPDFPPYCATRTTIFLMAIAKIHDIVERLMLIDWPGSVPCAVIERASCRDQRVIRCRLENVVEAIETLGQKPPGLLVVGDACDVLRESNGNTKKWVVEDGLRGGEEGWGSVMELLDYQTIIDRTGDE